jgi:hypothetical protein
MMKQVRAVWLANLRYRWGTVAIVAYLLMVLFIFMFNENSKDIDMPKVAFAFTGLLGWLALSIGVFHSIRNQWSLPVARILPNHGPSHLLAMLGPIVLMFTFNVGVQVFRGHFDVLASIAINCLGLGLMLLIVCCLSRPVHSDANQANSQSQEMISSGMTVQKVLNILAGVFFNIVMILTFQFGTQSPYLRNLLSGQHPNSCYLCLLVGCMTIGSSIRSLALRPAKLANQQPQLPSSDDLSATTQLDLSWRWNQNDTAQTTFVQDVRLWIAACGSRSGRIAWEQLGGIAMILTLMLFQFAITTSLGSSGSLSSSQFKPIQFLGWLVFGLSVLGMASMIPAAFAWLTLIEQRSRFVGQELMRPITKKQLRSIFFWGILWRSKVSFSIGCLTTILLTYCAARMPQFEIYQAIQPVQIFVFAIATWMLMWAAGLHVVTLPTNEGKRWASYTLMLIWALLTVAFIFGFDELFEVRFSNLVGGSRVDLHRWMICLGIMGAALALAAYAYRRMLEVEWALK